MDVPDLRSLLGGPDVLLVPGAYDVISARLIEEEGFPAVYVGGLVCCASMLGLPDHSLVTTAELLDHSRRIADAVNIPVISDVDDGGGTPLNVARTVRQFERAGVSAVHIEDHIQGKHLGSGGDLIPRGSMVQKLKAAVDARQNSEFLVIARCDALLLGQSLGAALERGLAYAEAGADMLFFSRLMPSEAQWVAERVPVPLFGIGHNFSRKELEKNHLKIAIYYDQLLMAALFAARDILQDLKTRWRIDRLEDRTIPRDFFDKLVGATNGIARARKYGLVG